jgi:CRP/FNR family cyclic AMP-dependent transcriptional regulator
VNPDSQTAAGGSAPQTERAQLAEKLAAHPFFGGMSAAQLAIFAEYATATHFAAGQVIFMEGGLANCFYLILDGCVALEVHFEHGPAQELEQIRAGEVLGWSWMFPPFRWHFGARAIELTSAIFIYVTWLLERCDQDPELALELMKRVSGVMMRRLQTTRQRLGRAPRASAG